MSIKTTIHNYQPGKSIESVMIKYGIKNVIKLASNENPIGPSVKAIDAAKKKILSINRYPDSKSSNLKLALKKFLSMRHIDLDNLIIGNGSNEILEFIFYLNSNKCYPKGMDWIHSRRLYFIKI